MTRNPVPVSILRLFLLAACVPLLFPNPVAAQRPANTSPASLTVMTYNLRYASANPPNAWPQRRPLLRDLIHQLAPDVMGTQEGVYSQLKDLASDLPEFEWIGLGREGGSRGEFMAVFYRKARLEPLAYDHFWLSDTPEVMNSSTWGNSNRRMVTWVKFRDRSTGGEFFLLNTHFDHQIQPAREKSAELVRSRVAALNTTLPVVLIGDFNAAAGANKAYEILTAEKFFTDTWLIAPERIGEGVGTFNNFKAVVPNGARIDWILTRGDVKVERAEISTFSRDGQFPSDHFPVTARLVLSSAKPEATHSASGIRINAGSGETFTDSNGNVWLPDRGFVGGDIVARSNDMKIQNTKDAALYRTEHWGMESFSQPVTNGSYVVKLHFAETYEGIEGPGGRVFSFDVEGREFKNFDVWMKAGGPRRAYVETVNAVVADGKLDIMFTSGSDSPEINGIEILPSL